MTFRTPDHVTAVDLGDPASVVDFLDLVLPPLAGQATFAFVPASGNFSTTGTVCLVDDMPARVTRELVTSAARTAAKTAASIEPAPAVLLALHRGGEQDLRESDVVWVDAARGACDEYDVSLLGVWLKVGRGAAVRMDAD